MTNMQSERRGFGGVEKDPLDLRDRIYEPSLEELSFAVDNRGLVPKILDQVGEGACTGFALAAVVNFLLHNRRKPLKDFVSPRMLYEMAKRYDEWEGENYEGSSIRAAMKGWHKHGVCKEEEWLYAEGEPGELTPQRQSWALRRPLGAYFRVRHLHLNHMHSALNEAGILYASAAVHEGWYMIDPSDGRIPFRRDVVGRHAFAIVGYDEDGFWIQNSWGDDWGQGGFCHISYDDWLENGSDCWVARLGVPTSTAAVSERPVDSRIAGFGYVPHAEVVQEVIKPHYVNLGNDGVFSDTGDYTTTPEEARLIIQSSFKDTVSTWSGTPKLLLYAHGGLTEESTSASRIYSMRPYFLDNEIYPVHFMWETGLLDSIKGVIQDAFRRGPLMSWRDELRERFYDLLDGAIEIGARKLGRPVWAQMKDNAERASFDSGGAAFVADQIAEYQANVGPVELHLVGHSAGSIFHAYLVSRLRELDIEVKTLTLWAPACTIELFGRHLAPHVGDGIERLTMFNLTDEFEQEGVTEAYHKSILYLVSSALEPAKNTPLLGMEVFAGRDGVRDVLGAPAHTGESTVIYSVGGAEDVTLRSSSKTHGGFDQDDETLDSMLRIIRGRDALSRTFG